MARYRFGLSRARACIGPYFFVMLLSMAGSPAVAACGYDNIKISGSPEESEIACDAVGDVLTYFRDLGFTIDPTVEIHFKAQVFCDFQADNTATESCNVQVPGLYDHNRKVVEITSADSPFRDDRKPWGVDWGEEISYSILQHELTHMAVGEILGEDFRNLSAPWHEFIAYAVQFELMGPSLRSRVLNAYPDAKAFADPGNINPVIHAIDPDAFGVRSYLYATAQGGRQFVADVIDRATAERLGGSADYLWTY